MAEPLEGTPEPSQQIDLDYITKEQNKATKVRQEAEQYKPGRDQGLKSLQNLAGHLYGTRSSDEMADYLRAEAIKDAPNKRLLVSPEASRFFNYEARSAFGYEPKVDAPIYNLDAYREGLKRSEELKQATIDYESSLKSNTTPPDLAYIGITSDPLKEGEKAPLVLIPKWKNPEESQQYSLDKFSSYSAGTPRGALAGVEVPEELRALQQRTLKLSDEELKAIGADELLTYRDRSRATMVNFDSTFMGNRYRPDEVLVYLAPVSGQRYAVNLKAYEDDFYAAYTEILAQEAGFRSLGEALPGLGGGLSDKEFQALLKEARAKAQSDTGFLQQQGRPGALYVDDPNKLARDIVKGEDPLAYLPTSSATVFAPLKMFGEKGEALYEQILKQRGPWASLFYPHSARAFNHGTLFYADQVEDINPGVLHWLASIAGSTVLGSYIFGPEDLIYGSTEHIKRARHYNFVEDLGKVGTGIADQLTKWGAPEFLEGPVMAAGTTAAIITMLFEPDPITLAAMPWSAAGKAAKLAGRGVLKGLTGVERASEAFDMMRGAQYHRLIDEVEGKLATGEIAKFNDIPKYFRQEGASELADMYEILLLNRTTAIRGGHAEGKKYSDTLDTSRNNLAALRTEITGLETTIQQETQAYIQHFGHHPKGKAATPAQHQLARAKQAEFLEESTQAYAAQAEAEFKLRQAAAVRGVQWKTSLGLEDQHEALLKGIEVGRDAFHRLQANLDKIDQLLARKTLLQSYAKLTTAQAEEVTSIELLFGKLAEANTADRALARGAFVDGTIEALYRNYKAAEEVYAAKVVKLAKSLPPKDLTSGAVTAAGVVVATAKKLRGYDKKLAKVKTEKAKLAHKANIAATKDILKQDIQDFLTASFDVGKGKRPISLGPKGKGLNQRLRSLLQKEAHLKVVSDIAQSTTPVLKTLKNSIQAYRSLLKTPTADLKALDTPPELMKFLKPDLSDPQNPKIILDQDAYRNALNTRYVQSGEEGVNKLFGNLMTQRDDFRRLMTGPAANAVPVSRADVLRLGQMERLLIQASKDEKLQESSKALAMINLWKSPEFSSSNLLGMNGTDPLAWIKRFVKTEGRAPATFRGASQFATEAGVRLHRGATKVVRAIDPTAHRTAPLARNIQEASLIAVSRQTRANEEMTLLFDQWVRKGDKIADNVVEFLTTNRVFNLEFKGQKVVGKDGLGAGGVAVTNQSGRTPWDKFSSYILELPDDAAQANYALTAAAHAFLPRATDANTIGPQIIGAALKSLKTNGSFEHFINAIKVQTKAALGQAGHLEDVDRAYAFIAKGVLHGSVVEDFLYDLSRAAGPAMTESSALAANAILTQVRGDVVREGGSIVKLTATASEKALDNFTARSVAAEYGFDPTTAFHAMNQWGQKFAAPQFTSISRGLSHLGDLTTELAQVTKSSDPLKAQFASHALIKQIEEAAGNISKSLDAIVPTDSNLEKALGSFDVWLRWWRKSVIMGVAFPRAAYFSNQIAGDFSQLWMTESLMSIRKVQLGKDKGKLYATGAAPLIFQNAFTYIPHFGNWTADYLAEMAKSASKSGKRPWLTTPLNALFNGHVAQVYRMSDEFAETPEGMRTYKQLMSDAAEDGVFDSMMTEDLYKMMGDLSKNPPSLWSRMETGPKLVEDYSRYWGDMITTIQGRQRMALYLEYRLMRGESRTASKQAVHNSFYDWRYGVTEWEMKTIGKLIAFYPFFRLAGKQMGRALLEPFTEPLASSARKALTGQTQIARVRAQANIVNTAPNYIWGEDQDQALSEWEITQEAQRGSKPWYLGARPYLSNDLMDAETRRYYKQRHGRDYSHVVTTMPMWTALDMMDLYHQLFTGIGGFMLAAGTKGQIRPTADSNAELERRATDFMFPVIKEGVRGVLGSLTPHQNVLGKRLRPGEVDVYNIYANTPLIGEFIEPIPGENGYYVNARTVNMLRNFPIVGTEFPKLYSQIYGANPGWEKDTRAAMSHMLREWTNIARQMPYSPEQDLEYTRKDIQAGFKEHQRALESRVKSRGGPVKRFTEEED